MAMIGRTPARAIASTADIADNSITSAKIAADVIAAGDVAPNAITASELADDAVDIAALSATGTADNTTFLRGDNSWQIVDTEGTGIKSTGEGGGNKFLREDGDGTSSWQVAGSPSITDNGNATAMTIDSAEDVTFEKRAIIPSLKPKSNQNLTGTYADHEMIMGDQFTLTGDLTINDNLVLASLSGSGQDITITDDGNGRTITTAGKVISCTTTNTDATVTTADTSDLRAGTGVTGTGIPSGATIASVTNATTFELSAAATASGTVNLTFDTAVFEAGEFLGSPPLQTDIGDMTSGVLNSAITGSPALNLSNATFDGNFIRQNLVTEGTSIVSTNSASWSVVVAGVITVKANSKVIISVNIPIAMNTDSTRSHARIRQHEPSTIYVMADRQVFDEHHASTGGFFAGVFKTGTLAAGTYNFDLQGSTPSSPSGGTTFWSCPDPGGAVAGISTMLLQEEIA